MSEYLREVKRLCDQLTFIGHPVCEKAQIFVVIHGLGRDYEPIITVIESSMGDLPCPIYESVVSHLVGYDYRLRGIIQLQKLPHILISLCLIDLKGLTTTTKDEEAKISSEVKALFQEEVWLSSENTLYPMVLLHLVVNITDQPVKCVARLVI